MALVTNDPPNASSTSKPAIKGFSLTSKALSKPGAKTASKPSPASSLGKRARSHFAAYNSDSDEESGNEEGVKHEAVTAFDASGAIRENEKKKEGPLVIPSLGNRDWKAEARARMGRGKNLLPPEVQAQQEAARLEKEGKADGVKNEDIDVINSNGGEVKWGLSVRKKLEDPVETTAEEQKHEYMNVKVEESETEKPKTADEEALEALLGKRKERKGPDLVIPASSAEEDTGPISEADAYRRAIAMAPDASTLEDYERVPVEEFGAALLRGMGWKGPSANEKSRVKEIKKRPNLLGLGAKELKDAEELGAWVQKRDVKKSNAGSDRRSERRPRVSEYKREKEKRDERREERGGGSYRRERERDNRRDDMRDYRDRDRERDRDGRR
jgi:hypothetical protein